MNPSSLIASLSDSAKSLLTGGLVAGALFYLISAAMQGVGIYHVAKKSGFGKTARIIFVAATVIIPFGIEVCLLIIAFDKKDRKAHSKVS